MTTELKVVMFTDQVQSTPNTSRRTSTEIAQVARDQDHLTSEVLGLTQGVLLKDTGDGCFVQFSSVLQAVQAGVLLQQRVTDRNATQRKEQLKFELHIGIDLGELVVLPNGDLRGDAVNRCARICTECPAGEVYLSDTAARVLSHNEVELESLGTTLLEGVKAKTKLHRVRAVHIKPKATPNPFIWRSGITSADDFFDREQEQHTLRAYLHGRQNCQIVGPRRIGKTTLLRQVERAAPHWNEHTEVAYLDLQDPRCFTLSGWLNQVTQRCQWSCDAQTLADLAESVEKTISSGRRPVLCLDEFEELTTRRADFTRDFFVTLRACAQQGLSIITASQRPLSELTDRGDPTSPFYNTFPLLRLGPFRTVDAEDFINMHRPGIPAFNTEEHDAILEFSKGHPLALQIACFHVLAAKENGYSVAIALQRSTDDMNAHLPSGW